MPTMPSSFTALAVALDASTCAVSFTSKPEEATIASGADIELGIVKPMGMSLDDRASGRLMKTHVENLTKEDELKLVEAWISWSKKIQPENKEWNVVRCKAAMVSLVEHKAGLVDAPFDREVTQLSFLLSVVVALVVCVEYLGSNWPEGSFYFCQLPYVVSIVSFKPFAVPMWYCLTVVAHVTFVEATFGHSVDYREESGALAYSPLPRNPASRAAVFVVQATFFAWFAIMIVSCLPSLVVFSPLLLVPGFIAPLVVMHLPSSVLGAAVSYVRRTHVKLAESKAANTQEPAKAAKETSPHCAPLAFSETVFILKVALTQVVSLAMIALPMSRFFAGRLTYAEAADQLFSSLDLRIAFSVTLAWPAFHAPRFHVYLGLSVGIIAFKNVMQLVRAAVAFLEYYLPLVEIPGPRESRANAAFAWATYHPMRAASDLVRTAIETTVVGHKDFNNVVFNGFPEYYLGERLGEIIERAPNWLVVLAGPFFIAYSLPWTMIFAPDATDEDVEAWASDQICMAYRGVVCRHKAHATKRTLVAIAGCPWLEHIDIDRCIEIEGKVILIFEYWMDCKSLSDF
jgi:hypothetical protein